MLAFLMLVNITSAAPYAYVGTYVNDSDGFITGPGDLFVS